MRTPPDQWRVYSDSTGGLVTFCLEYAEREFRSGVAATGRPEPRRGFSPSSAEEAAEAAAAGLLAAG